MPTPCSDRFPFRSDVHGNHETAEKGDGFDHARPENPGAGDQVGVRQARPAADDQEPRDVRGRDRGRAGHLHLRPRSGHGRREPRLHVPDYSVAVVHRAVRQFRGGRRRRPRQDAGGIAQEDADRKQGQAAGRLRQELPAGVGHQPQGWRCRAGGSRRQHPQRWRGDRGRCVRQRGRDYRGIRARDSRIRRRPFGGDRRHPGAIGLDPRSHHRGAGLDFHRPHDQAGGRRRAAEDAERDRAQYPARGPDHHLRVCDGDNPELRGIRRWLDLVIVLVALFVTLIPTTIGALLSAIGIAGMDRLVRFNVLAMSGRAVEAAGDVDTLLLDKTGTITLGNRQATEFLPVNGVNERDLADASQLASLSDETPERRSIVVLAKEKYNIRGREMAPLHAKFTPFSAYTRISRIDLDGSSIRKGAVDAVIADIKARESAPSVAREVETLAEKVARSGGTPLAVSRDGRLLGVIHLKDIVKGGIRDRFATLRRMGIRTVMITGDNPLTAAAIAAESGVDDFLAQATPETKLKLIRDEQAEGKLVAMCGDGTNDAPALAQADVGVAMNTGTSAAKEAGNMVDLDSNPTKLIEVVEIGKQLLMTRGALTTFSIANDVAKYFAIIPAMFLAFYPQLQE